MARCEEFHSDVLTLELQDKVAVLWLDRPDARNAMGPEFWRDLPTAMAAVSDDDEARALVIAARGPHFSVGLDLKSMMGALSAPAPSAPASGDTTTSPKNKPSMAARANAARRSIIRLQQAVNAVAECPKPVIAAVHGACIGGGVDLIAACDIRLASRDAMFSVRETKIAIVADLGSLQRLPKIIGMGHVAELAYTGKDIDATRAKEIGLMNDVYDDQDAVVKAARSLALEIAANSPLAVQGTKEILRMGEHLPTSEGLAYVATWNAGFLASDDLKEAVTSFWEKRAPTFSGT